jgi:hypothetical protein
VRLPEFEHGVKLELQDLEGRGLCTASGDNDKFELDVSKITPGIYLLYAYYGGNKTIKKVIVTR